MAGEVDYSKFSREELEAEIRREEEALTTLRTDLRLAERRRADAEAAFSEERIAELQTRTRLRQERIERYEHDLRELDSQISRHVDRVASRDREISGLQRAISRETARLASIRSPVERYITTETIAQLRRTLSALQGWQTRDIEYLVFVRNIYAGTSRILSGLRGWQIRETAILERVDELRESLVRIIAEINSLKTQIDAETYRLERKRSFLITLTIKVNNPQWGTTTPAPGTYRYRSGTTAIVTAIPAQGYKLDYWDLDGTRVEPQPNDTISVLMAIDHTLIAVFSAEAVVVIKQLVDVKIIVYSIVRGRRKRKYTKRLQAFYDVDALRDHSTGEIDYSSKLTQKEIDKCIDYFYALWNWTSLPDEASKPVWIESGEWREITEPQGADLKQVSVREEEEETYNNSFSPFQVVYTPTEKEKREMLRLKEGQKE